LDVGEEEAIYPFVSYRIVDSKQYPEATVKAKKVFETLTVEFNINDKFPNRSRIIDIANEIEQLFEIDKPVVPYVTSNNICIVCSHLTTCYTTTYEKISNDVFWNGIMRIEFVMEKDWSTR
jgi:hypothetical protein